MGFFVVFFYFSCCCWPRVPCSWHVLTFAYCGCNYLRFKAERQQEEKEQAAKEKARALELARKKAAERGQRALRRAKKANATDNQSSAGKTKKQQPSSLPSTQNQKRQAKLTDEEEIAAIDEKLAAARVAADNAAAAAEKAGLAKSPKTKTTNPQKTRTMDVNDEKTIQRALPYISPPRPSGRSHKLKEIPNGASLLREALSPSHSQSQQQVRDK